MKARCGLLVLKSRPGAVVESLLALRRVSWPTRRRLDFEVFCFTITSTISGDIKSYLEVVAKPYPHVGVGEEGRVASMCVSPWASGWRSRWPITCPVLGEGRLYIGTIRVGALIVERSCRRVRGGFPFTLTLAK